MIPSTQAATLKALAKADPPALGYMTNAQDAELARWFNVPTTFVVPDEIPKAVGLRGNHGNL